MFGFIKRLFGLGSFKDQEIDLDDIVHEQWHADFSRDDKPANVRFSITSEKLYCAYLGRNALCLELKKTGCIAWSENMYYRYQDLDIKGRVRLDPKKGYAAAGFIFRMVDTVTYYMLLVSNRGYFRLDLVRNNVPLTLAGWTEAPGMSNSNGCPIEFDLELLCYGSRFLLLINDHWAGLWDDPSISEGRIAFTAASYESGNAQEIFASPEHCSALAELLNFSLDSRIGEVQNRYEEKFDTASPESRIKLAETFTALGMAGPALAQLRKAWETRAALAEELDRAENKVILAAMQTEGQVKTGDELLLGAKLTLALELWSEAEEYIETALNTKASMREAHNMKAALLYSSSRYADLINWAIKNSAETGFAKTSSAELELDFRTLDSLFADPAAFYNLLGHAYFNTSDYQKAAAVYEYSFSLDEKNGITAKNAAVAYELLIETVTTQTEKTNPREKALECYLKAGRAFLTSNHYSELGLLIPKFRLLGGDNWEARALTGKWAFGIENWKIAQEELNIAEQYRKKKHGFSPDPALYFLQALLLVREGKQREALSLFEKAGKLAPDYPLFRFRLAESRLLLNNNPNDPDLTADLEAALAVKNDDESYGWIHNFAAHVALSKGDAEKARVHLENAAAMLGELPAVRVNRAVFFYLRGAEDEALRLLESKAEDDPEGLMANCAGNLLVRSRRFEEADVWYRRALAAAPFNIQYRYNRGSCLIELGHYGEADDVLTAGADSKHFSPETSPAMLELIAFVAVKKGEHKRAEAASRAALKIDPDHVPSLLQLGWNRAFSKSWDEVEEILDRLDELELNEDTAKGRDDLELWMNEALYKIISCASCSREWEVERNPMAEVNLRLYAMPPDDMPAGTCPSCLNTYCVGCRKDSLDESGRFVCPDCSKTLKLTDSGLKVLLNDWAKENLKKKRGKKEAKQKAETEITPEQEIAPDQEAKLEQEITPEQETKPEQETEPEQP